MQLYSELGPKWGQLAQRMPGRTKRQIRVRAASLARAQQAAAAVAANALGQDNGGQLDPAQSWEAVNRRRVRGKGWHVDIGPGFNTDWARTMHGHRLQGLVILVLVRV